MKISQAADSTFKNSSVMKRTASDRNEYNVRTGTLLVDQLGLRQDASDEFIASVKEIAQSNITLSILSTGSRGRWGKVLNNSPEPLTPSVDEMQNAAPHPCNL